MSLREKYQPSSQLNLTSMVDIIFMLLIIVIITAPLMHAQVDLSLPKSSAAKVADESTITISIKRDGSVFLGNTRVSIEKLPRLLWKLRQERRLTSVALRADEKVEYGIVMEVIGAIKDAGIEDLGLVALPKKTK
ncbi:biopolymer transporter ExbD [bacterium]|nr:biopolymer transporter ExbD [bacterium]